MNLIVYALALYFAASLGIAGISKLDEPLRFEGALRQQQVIPDRFISVAAILVPCLEISLAGLLLSGVAAGFTAELTIALFGVFLALKIALFARKSEADCGCTTGNRPHPVTRNDVVAAAILVAVACVYFLLALGSQPLPWQARLTIGSVFGAVGLFLLGTTVVRRWIEYRRISPPFEVGGLAVGNVAPTLTGVDQMGQSIALENYRGHRLLVAFITPGCAACASTVKTLTRWARSAEAKQVGAPDIIFVAIADGESTRAYAAKNGLRLPLVTPEEAEVARDLYQISKFPTVFALDEQGMVRARGGIVVRGHLEGLLQRAFGAPAIRPVGEQTIEAIEAAPSASVSPDLV